MRKWSRYVVGVVAITGWLALVVSADAETCKLEAKRLDQANEGNAPDAYWFQSTRPQSFFKQIGGPEGMIRGPQQEGMPEFSTVITKEPSYNSQQPFRGVAKLGSQHFGFAFDTAKPAPKEEPKKEEPATEEPKEEAKTEGVGDLLVQVLGANKAPATVAFERLYFDVNHNGDLSDDPVVEATMSQNRTANYAYSQFPPVGVTIDVDEAKVEYAFTMNVYSYTSSDYAYANASLNAAAYRVGEMAIDGKTRRIVVVDSNSNGRYDDQSGIDSTVQLADGTVYPKMGDMLYVIDPDTPLGNQGNPYDPSTNDVSHFVGKQVNMDGRFLDLKITPAGDELTLEPSKVPVGYVTNANKGYRAIVYGEQGFLKIAGDESGKAPLPVGQWKLASYTLEKTLTEEAAKEQAEEGSVVDALKQLIGGGGPAGSQRRSSIVSARGKQDVAGVEVTDGQTVELPFGEPYRPVVTLGYREGADRASLSMSLVGCSGEVCTNMTVNGGRPGKPKFTISTEKGEVVETGNFEYG